VVEVIFGTSSKSQQNLRGMHVHLDLPCTGPFGYVEAWSVARASRAESVILFVRGKLVQDLVSSVYVRVCLSRHAYHLLGTPSVSSFALRSWLHRLDVLEFL
jgi:hypothetical protein